MPSTKVLAGVAIAVAAAFALAACSEGPPANDPVGIDAQDGIPADSISPGMLKPNGTMNNGLLPAQPYDTGG